MDVDVEDKGIVCSKPIEEEEEEEEDFSVELVETDVRFDKVEMIETG